MALIEFQKTILRLYTDRSFQQRFFADRKEALRAVLLTGREERVLASLPEKGLRLFYGELFHKRREFMTAILRKAKDDPVIVSSFYIKNPVIMFRDKRGERVVEISPRAFLILESMAGSKITLTRILQACASSFPAGSRDALTLAAVLTKYGIMGRNVKVL